MELSIVRSVGIDSGEFQVAILFFSLRRAIQNCPPLSLPTVMSVFHPQQTLVIDPYSLTLNFLSQYGHASARRSQVVLVG